MDIERIKKVADWIVPPHIFELGLQLRFKLLHRKGLQLSQVNKIYNNLHQGRRCFIVCNGPSINNQNLLLLKNEMVFSVSSGYHHKDYAEFAPGYHCVPQITYTEKWTEEVTVAWFREMHERIGGAELFLSHTEESLVRLNNLFPGRRVNYLCMYGNFSRSPNRPLDIAGRVPGVCSVPVMCLIIAMYMGLKEIYLLGVDHDSFKTNEYKYFFKQTVLDGKNGGVAADDKISDPLCDELYGYYRLFCQYRAIKRIAVANGVKIYNATVGGALDEFPRIALDAVFQQSDSV